MGLNVTVALLLGIGAAVAHTLLAEEVKAWLPRIFEKIIIFETKLVPKALRERLNEEWQSHLSEIPGNFGRLTAVLGFLFASLALRREYEQRHDMRLRENEDMEFLEQMGRIIEPTRSPLITDFVSGVSTFPGYCYLGDDGTHEVPGAALYYSVTYGGMSFQGSCVHCGEWVDTGEYCDC